MNKRKIAVFVEGQTELVFIRELLVKWFGYDEALMGFDCYNLLNNELVDTSYSRGNLESENFYMLVNVGNDRSVLSKIRDRMCHLVSLGYQVVIGLRDMYSAQYIKDVNGRRIDDAVTKAHIDAVKEQVALIPNGEIVDFHFSIMEIEAWLLGMPQFLKAIDSRLTKERVFENTGINLLEDPEVTFFHPATTLGRIYGLVGKKYDKHGTNISSVMAALQVEDFLALARSGRCLSFKAFLESLLGFPIA